MHHHLLQLESYRNLEGSNKQLRLRFDVTILSNSNIVVLSDLNFGIKIKPLIQTRLELAMEVYK